MYTPQQKFETKYIYKKMETLQAQYMLQTQPCELIHGNVSYC
jgi:hypothetical protein